MSIKGQTTKNLIEKIIIENKFVSFANASILLFFATCLGKTFHEILGRNALWKLKSVMKARVAKVTRNPMKTVVESQKTVSEMADIHWV